MLEKNKDYVEFTLQYTSVDWSRSNVNPEVLLNGYSDFYFPGVPIMDVVCKEFDHKVVVVGKRDFDRLQAENEELKKKLREFDPIPEYKELLEKLYSVDDAEKLEWTLNHICGGRASVNGWMAISKFWKQNCEALSKLVGFSSVEEIEDYLTNEVEADTLQEAISKLEDEVKYTCDEWKYMHKKLKECEKDYISERDKAEALEKEIGIYRNTLNELKAVTGCPSPSAAKTLIESGASWHRAFNEAKKKNSKLIEEVDSWETATGYDDPKDFLKWKANIEGILDAWKSGTGCKFPSEARILLEKWKVLTKCETPEAAATWIASYESACERGNKLADDVESWKNVTGYATPEDFLSARINNMYMSNLTWQQATGCDTPDQVKSRIEGLENAIRLTDKTLLGELEREIDAWQKATGRIDPEAAKQYIDRLTGRLNKIHDYSVDW